MTGLTSIATGETSGGTEYVAESSLGRDDRIFARRFKRALWRQQAAGVITAEENDLLRKALKNRKAIEGGRCFVQALRRRCETIAGDMFDNLNLVEWWNILTKWLIENWETILRIAITLIIAII